jgi:hypothetical protein
VNYSTLSPESETCNRSPAISSTAFDTRPPDLPPASLIDTDFAITCPLVRRRRPQIQFLFRPNVVGKDAKGKSIEETHTEGKYVMSCHVLSFSHRAVRAHLKEVPVDDDHFTIQALEGA